MPETNDERIARADAILTSHVEWFDAAPGFKLEDIALTATNEPKGHYDNGRDWRLVFCASLLTDPNRFRFEVSWQVEMLTNRGDRRSSAMVYKEPEITKTTGLPEGTVPQKRYAKAVLTLAEYLDAWKNTHFYELVSLINEPVRVHLVNQYARPAIHILPLYEERTSPW